MTVRGNAARFALLGDMERCGRSRQLSQSHKRVAVWPGLKLFTPRALAKHVDVSGARGCVCSRTAA